MFGAVEWGLAGRYLRARGQGFISVIAWFSFLGIMLGVATLIIVMSVMNGFRAELMDRILGLNGHIVAQSFGPLMEDYDRVAADIRKLEGIRAARPLIEGQAMAMISGRATGVLVRGAKPDDLRARRLIADGVVSGSIARFGMGDGLLIGDRLASKLGVRVGDRITLVAALNMTTPFGQVPRNKSYPIIATFNVGMYEYDSSFVFMPMKAAQLFYKLGDRAHGVELIVERPEQVRDYRQLIAGTPGVGRMTDWQQANAHFFSALEVERNVMFLILTLIIVVAAFNIISSLIMMVKEKGRAIAILRTMGASRGMVMRIFLIAGASVGVVGTLVGFAIGLAFCNNIDEIRLWLEGLTGAALWSPEIRFLSRIPAQVDNAQVVAVVAMSLVLSFLATLYPAWRASRLDPVEALRNE